MSREDAIAVFDSGIGGLTVLKAIKEQLPNEQIIYLADTKRMPYGSRDPLTLQQYTKEALDFFQKQKVKLVVFACHTVSSIVTQTFPLPVINVIQGAMRAIGESVACKKIAILGTERTIQSRVYEKLIQTMYPGMEVVSVSCPKLASMIESQDPQVENAVDEYIAKLSQVDAVLLACTHYPLIRPLFEKRLGNRVCILDSAKNTAIEIKEFLMKKELLSTTSFPKYSFYATESSESFALCASFYLRETVQTSLVNLT